MTLATNVVGNEGVVQRPSRRKVPWARLARRAATVALSLAIGIALWGLLSLRYPTQLLPSPAETFDAFTDLWSDGTIVESVMKSSQRILSGWALGLLVGVPLGLVMGRFSLVRTLLDPWVEFFRFIPPISFVTLAVIWLGIGESSKIVLIFYTSVFIVTINTVAGVLSVEESRLRAAESLGASRARVLRSVVLPSSVPHIVTGARVAMGNSFLTIVSAEIVAANVGLGALIWRSRNYGRTEWVFVGVIVLGALGFLFDRVLRIGARRFLSRYQVKV
ncbi:MAG: taurine transport system permease protein [Candidatus Azotimanducaceae bacterium]|jgi:taurine transport system permease protein